MCKNCGIGPREEFQQSSPRSVVLRSYDRSHQDRYISHRSHKDGMKYNRFNTLMKQGPSMTMNSAQENGCQHLEPDERGSLRHSDEVGVTPIKVEAARELTHREQEKLC